MAITRDRTGLSVTAGLALPQGAAALPIPPFLACQGRTGNP